LRELSVVEGTLRRTLPQLHALAQRELLAADLNGYANLREHWVYALRVCCAFMQEKGVPEQFVSQIYETVPEVPDLMSYAVNAPPPSAILQQVGELFPEWVRTFAADTPLLERGTTTVATSQSVDPEGADIKRLLYQLESHGHGAVLEEVVQGEIWGIPIENTVKVSLRMAAAFDLYVDLRLGSVPQQSAPRKRFFIDPAWILLGLSGATVAAHAAGEVLSSRARAQQQGKKRSKSVSELAEFIRQQEG